VNRATAKVRHGHAPLHVEKMVHVKNSIKLGLKCLLIDIFIMTSNSGKSWTTEEFDTLLSELRAKKTDKEIAEAHGRTVNAIKFKALGYACDQVLKEGKTKEEVLLDLGLSEGVLQKELDLRTRPKVKSETTRAAVVVKKAANTPSEDLAEIWSSVNRLQSLVHTYMNKVSPK